MENLGPSAILDFKIRGFQLLWASGDSSSTNILNLVKIRQSTAELFSGVNLYKFVSCFSELGEPIYTKFGDVRGPSQNLLILKKMSDTLFRFETTAPQRPNFALFTPTVKLAEVLAKFPSQYI